MKDDNIMGIDLGINYNYTAIYSGEQVRIVPHYLTGDYINASLVCFNNEECLVGIAAENAMKENPTNTLIYPKKLIGRFFDDPEIQEEIKYWPVKIIKDFKTGKPQYQIKVNDEEKKFFPEEVYAIILKELKSFASLFRGREINKAILTVPAYFNEEQREATKKGAELAGIYVIKIINESTAIALSRKLNFYSAEKRIILIFNLREEIADVTIIKVQDDKFITLSSCYNASLGENDFTNLLNDFELNQFKKDYGFEDVDFYDKNNKKESNFLMELKNHLKEAKFALSFRGRFSGEISYKDEVFFFEVLDVDYQEICKELYNKCIDLIKKALFKAELYQKDIDDIILAGFSPVIPRFKEMIGSFFEGKNIYSKYERCEEISKGALIAYMENIIEDNQIKRYYKELNEIRKLINKNKFQNDVLFEEIEVNLLNLENKLKKLEQLNEEKEQILESKNKIINKKEKLINDKYIIIKETKEKIFEIQKKIEDKINQLKKLKKENEILKITLNENKNKYTQIQTENENIINKIKKENENKINEIYKENRKLTNNNIELTRNYKMLIEEFKHFKEKSKEKNK